MNPPEPQIVVVCGGRAYTDWNKIQSVLNAVHQLRPIRLLITGGAMGADELADKWAERFNIPRLMILAQWDKFGPSAGPRRNAAMIKAAPDLIIAFPGGRGTADMIGKAQRAKLKLLEVV